MDEIVRKSSREAELDHLFAEEFLCDPGFVERYLAACGIDIPAMVVDHVVEQPSLGGSGFGDLLIQGRIPDAEHTRITLLIEHKIDAAAALRQAARYRAYADRLRSEGEQMVCTVLCAPASYQGEREEYDAFIDLLTASQIMRSESPARLAHRRGIVERALQKKASQGVRNPDPLVRDLRAAYLDYMAERFASDESAPSFPPLRSEYHEGDAWIENIRSPALPDCAILRHRLAVNARDNHGAVDLIYASIDDDTQQLIRAAAPDWAEVNQYPIHTSTPKGVMLSVHVPKLDQRTGFVEQSAASAEDAMRNLLRWAGTVDLERDLPRP